MHLLFFYPLRLFIINNFFAFLILSQFFQSLSFIKTNQSNRSAQFFLNSPISTKVNKSSPNPVSDIYTFSKLHNMRDKGTAHFYAEKKLPFTGPPDICGTQLALGEPLLDFWSCHYSGTMVLSKLLKVPNKSAAFM